jgi:hypothetical protein
VVSSRVSLGTKRPDSGRSSTTGWRPSRMDEGAAGGHGGADVAAGEGAFGEGGEHVEFGDGGGGLLEDGGVGDDVFAQREEQLVFERDGLVLGAEDLVLAFLELGGDEALAVDDGLLADVVVGDLGEVGFGDFDEVAEDLVEADLEGLDAGALDFAGLELGDPLLAVVGGGAQFVELGVEALADDAAFLDGHGRLVDERAVDAGDEVVLRLDGGGEFAEASGGAGREGVLQGREAGEGEAEGADVASVAGAGGEAREQAFEILDVAEDAAQGVEVVALGEQGFDGVVAGDDGGEVLEGADEPVAEEARAHGGAGGVEGLEQGDGGVGAGGAARGDQIEVGERGLVEHHGVGGGAEADAADVGGGAAEVAGDIIEQRAGGGGGGGMAFAAEAVERLHAEVAAEAVFGGGGVEDPVLAGGEGEGAGGLEGGEKAFVGVEGFGEDDLGGA